MASSSCCANGRELGGVLGHEHALDGGALAAEHGLHGREVALAERVVLGEDDDLLARGVADERAGRGDVLVGLAAGAERVSLAPVMASAAAGPEM